MKNKKTVSIILVVVLCVSMLCSCVYNPETVGTIEDMEIPAGIYLYYQMFAVSEALTKLNDSTITGPEALTDQQIDGVSAREWISERTIESCRKYVFIQKEYERLGLEFSAAELSSAEQQASSYWQNYATTYQSNGIGYDTLLLTTKSVFMEATLLSTLYGKGGEFALSEDEKEQFFFDNYTRSDYISFPTTDSDRNTLSETAISDMRLVADELAARANELGSFEKAYLEVFKKVNEITGTTDEYTAETFVSALKKNVMFSDTVTSVSSEFSAAVRGSEKGVYTVYQSGSTIYVYINNGLAADDVYTSNELSIINSIASTPFEEYIKTTAGAYTVSFNEKACEYYNINNVAV